VKDGDTVRVGAGDGALQINGETVRQRAA
jgi:hypothetical protein